MRIALQSATGFFCSALALRRGSVHVLGGLFARFCVSENARVPLRYSGQPLHRKIIASRSPNTPWFCLSNRFFSNLNHAVLPSLFVGARSCNAPCLPVNKLSPKIDRAACMWTSRHKNIRRRFAVGIFCRCSQLRRAYFAQGRTIDREGQYPWVLASGGVKPLRKRRRLNLVHMRAARSPKTIQACCTASPCNYF